MTKRILLSFFVLAACVIGLKAQTSRNYSVLIWADVSSSPASITVHFENDALATAHTVYRRELGDNGWSNVVKTFSKSSDKDLSFTDNSVVAGKSYEYFVYKQGNSGFQGFGYLNAGINLAAQHNRGTVLLIIAQSAMDSLGMDLEVLRNDLSGDGYRVVDLVVHDSMKHQSVKEMINQNAELYTDLTTLYIFGNVAVPYSGRYCADSYWKYPPDGHTAGVGDHCGAWAADVYYAIPNGTWTDNDTVFYGAGRAWNKNDIGDGKFDEIELPDTVKYQIGRVDLANMPAFNKSEFELLKQYIQKSHAYRYKEMTPYTRALIDENFSPSTEAFGGNGYRNFPMMVGRDNMIEADYLKTLADSTFIWAYGTGPGSFTSAGGIGNTNDFVAKQGAAIFNFLFGSFFGDWDNNNAFLRAPLACENGGLTNAWAGRPWWHVHPMGMDQTIGYCTKMVQNNVNNYVAANFGNNIHIALMGDPTLRMHMFAPPTDVKASVQSNMMKVDLTWTASADAVDGYNVYFATSKHGTYYIANANPIKGTSYTHNSVGNGTYYYMVRAVRKETTLCGTFENLSQGEIVIAENLITSGTNDLSLLKDFTVFPNPTNGIIKIKYFSEGSDVEVKVTDINGKCVYTNSYSGYGENIQTLDLSGLSAGMYFLQAQGQTLKVIKN
ncbi:MAG: T9SS type A sorting domain-containing protein [Bacteroidetes bacterium]|nr:T9SS type A sorting domain-containing protein [Bacteroidota bacterium]